MEAFTVLNCRGSGCLGKTFTVQHRHSDELLSLKQIECRDECHANKCFREVSALLKLNHPSIQKIRDAFVDWDLRNSSVLVCIVSDCQKLPSLELMLEERRELAELEPFDVTTIRRYVGQMLDALLYAHRKGFLHRNLRPSNILFRSANHLILSDWAVPTALTDHLHTSRTKEAVFTYFAPELSDGAPVYTESSDFWALGCVLLDIVTCKASLQKPSFRYYHDMKSKPETVDILLNLTPELYHTELELFDLIRQLVNPNPGQRATAASLLDRDYVHQSLLCVGSALIKAPRVAKQPSSRVPLGRGATLEQAMAHLAAHAANEHTVLDTLQRLADLTRPDQAELSYVAKQLIGECLQNFEDDLNVQIAGADVLRNVVYGSLAGDYLFSASFARILLNSIALHSNSPGLVERALKLISAIAVDADARKILGKLDVVRVILEQLRNYQHHEDICSEGLCALWCLSSTDTLAQQFASQQGFALLVRLLDARGDTPTAFFCEMFAAAIIALLLQEGEIPKAVSHSAGARLLSVLELHVKHRGVVRNACIALSCLCEKDEASAFCFLPTAVDDPEFDPDSGGIRLLRRACQIHRDHAGVVEALCHLLYELAAYGEIHAELKYQRFDVDILPEIMRRFADNVQVGPAAKRALDCILKSPSVEEE